MAKLSNSSRCILQDLGKIFTMDVTTSPTRLLHPGTLPIEGNVTITEDRLTAEDLDASLMSVLMPFTIFIAVEASVGLVGNILILYIYSYKYSKCNFRYFVLFLACIDLTSCLTTLPAEIYIQINWYTLEHEWICKIKSYFNVFTVWGSGEILLLIALDRYRKVCRPLGSQIPTSLARKSGFCAIFIGSLAALPISFLWGKQTYTMRYKGFKVAVSTCEKSDKYENTLYPLIYIIITYSVPVGIMMLAAATFNILVVRKVFCNLQPVQDIKATCNTSHEMLNNVSGSWVRCRSNSLLIENDERSATHQQRYVEKGGEVTISTISGIAITESFKEYFEFFSHGNIVSEIKFKEVYQTSKIETLEVCKMTNNNLSNKCHTIFGCDVSKQVKTKKICGKNNIKLQKEQTISCTSNNLSGNRARPQKTNIKSVTASSRNTSSSSRSDMNDSSFHSRVRKKTIIMLILTSVFIVTTIVYVILLSFIADEGTFLQNLSDTQKVSFFFFLRLYFINSVINPILYGILDPRFRQGLKSLLCSEERTE